MALQQIQQINQQWSGTENCQIEQPKSLAEIVAGALGRIVPDVPRRRARSRLCPA